METHMDVPEEVSNERDFDMKEFTDIHLDSNSQSLKSRLDGYLSPPNLKQLAHSQIGAGFSYESIQR